MLRRSLSGGLALRAVKDVLPRAVAGERLVCGFGGCCSACCCFGLAWSLCFGLLAGLGLELAGCLDSLSFAGDL